MLEDTVLKVAIGRRWRVQVYEEPQRGVQGRLPVDHQSLFDESGEVKVLPLPLMCLAILMRAFRLL